jgi:hypothetical protein
MEGFNCYLAILGASTTSREPMAVTLEFDQLNLREHSKLP